MLVNNLRNVITTPTRITAHLSTLLYPIIISNNFELYKSGCYYIDELVSDHKATFIYLKSTHVDQECLTRKVWYCNRALILVVSMN